jgi:hypothetical protein
MLMRFGWRQTHLYPELDVECPRMNSLRTSKRTP